MLSSPLRRTLAALAGAACLLRPMRARGDEPGPVVVHDLDPTTGHVAVDPDHRVDYLNLGPLLSLVGGFHHATGLGFEASWITYPEGRMPSFGYGAFAQAQLYDGKYARVAAGAQGAAGPAGLELGLSLRQADDVYATTLAVHTGLFLSIGYFFFDVAASAQILALPSDRPSFGLETDFSFGLKLPLTIVGRDPTGYAIQVAPHGW